MGTGKNFKGLFLSFALLLSLVSTSVFASFKTVHEQEISAERITGIIEKYTPRVKSLTADGKGRIYLSGGSALAILDAVYDKKEIRMRDLDFFVVSGGPVDLSKEPDAVNPKTLKYPEESILTEFFFFEDEVKMNYTIGLFDVDKMKIKGAKLPYIFENIERGNLELLKKTRSEWLYDPLNSFQNWRDRTARVADVFVKSFYSQAVLRASRTFAKMGVYKIPKTVMRPFQTLKKRTDNKGIKKWIKGISKILSDKSYAHQVYNISGLGVFHHSPVLGAKIKSLSIEELIEVLDAPSEDPELQDYILRRTVNFLRLGSKEERQAFSEAVRAKNPKKGEVSLADKILL